MDYSGCTDQELVGQARTGDERAFRHLVEREIGLMTRQGDVRDKRGHGGSEERADKGLNGPQSRILASFLERLPTL